MQAPAEDQQPVHSYTISPFYISDLSNTLIFLHSSDEPETRGLEDIQPVYLDTDYGVFTDARPGKGFRKVSVQLKGNALLLTCACNTSKKKLCAHQARVLFCIMNRRELRLFFDKKLRSEALQQKMKDYGLDIKNDPDDFFELKYEDRQLQIQPRFKGLIPLYEASGNYLEEQLFPQKPAPGLLPGGYPAETQKILVLCRHRYSDQLNIELMEVQTGKDGRIKGTLNPLEPLDYLWRTGKPDELKYYAALLKIRNEHQVSKPENDIQALKALVRNPPGYAFYHHETGISGPVTTASLLHVYVRIPVFTFHITMGKKKDVHELTATLYIDDKPCALQDLEIIYRYFIRQDKAFYLATKPGLLRLIGFFKRHDYRIMVPQNSLGHFKEKVLARLEQQVHITYSDVKPATVLQLAEQGFDRETEWIIYLSEHENHIGIVPVVRYGDAEIPILSRKQVYATDKQGNTFVVQRDDKEELQLLSMLIRQHPDFAEQLDFEYFYLHKERFLDEDWFLRAFKDWQDHGITILGFNEIKKNKLNQYAAKVTVQVSSGLNWFNAIPQVNFGRQKASLKQLYKTVKNRSKYVQLDNGTLGILPTEWLERFARYFESGEIAGEEIRIPRINYAAMLEAYEDNMMLPGVKKDITALKAALSSPEGIKNIPAPVALQTTLRTYQQEGLNWLNFLDDLGFGACLADDMGLGKTVQVIAFLLHLQEKRPDSTHLIVMPTSLIFNWQDELRKFAPDLKVCTYYGTTRQRSTKYFSAYDLVLTAYGTLLSDIKLLKGFSFDYAILDESQAIKNPESERYQAAVQLQSRNRITLTGTPVENNTFDLYGQLSFACPGLLGNKHYFRNLYALPIDKFKNDKRALALQQKIAPFILRRTKEQVAQELPEKTEMVLYCPMGEEQRRIYDLQEKEIREFIATRQEEEITSNSMHVLKGLTRLRQICNATALINKEKAYGDYSSKINALMEELEQHAGQHKVLIFSQFVSMLELIRKELEQRHMAYAFLSGQTRNRAEQVTLFKEQEDVNVFLISLKAGGTGLNLTEADYVYLIDPWWNPAVENQAIDRSYRIGQQKHVIAVRLICPDTIEEKIMKLQESKKGLADNLIQTGSSVLSSLSRQDLLNLLS